MGYAVCAGIVSTSAEGLVKVMAVIVTDSETAGLTLAD